MDNMFTQAFPMGNIQSEIDGLGTVTIRPLGLKEYKDIMLKYQPDEGKPMGTDESLNLQMEVVAAVLIDPKMTIKQLGALPKSALPAITAIFVASQSDGTETEDEEGIDTGN